MINLLRKIHTKEYTCAMELCIPYGFYASVKHPSETSEEGFNLFFDENHFAIIHNIFDPSWDRKTILEEIFKKLVLIYNFNANDDNIVIIYDNKNPIYLPKNYCVFLPKGGIFVYDKSKLLILN